MSPTNGQGANGNRTVPVTNGKASYAEKHRLPEHFIGGNRLENAPPSKIKDFVASHDGHTVITNVRYMTRRFRCSINDLGLTILCRY